jgi:hypothetical protein
MAWDSARDHGYEDTADFFQEIGYAGPEDLESFTLEFSDGSWTLELDDGTTIELNDDAMDWVWEELYDFADEYGIEWDVEYAEN